MTLAHKSMSIFKREILFMLLRIFTGAAIARMLGPVGFGVWAALDLLTNYSRVFGGPRFEIASVYFLGQHKHSRGEIVFIVNLVALVSGILVASVLYSLVGPIERVFFEGAYVDPLLITLVILQMPLIFMKRNYHFFLISNENARSYNIMMVIDDITKASVTMALLLIFKMGLWSIICGKLLGSVLALIYGMTIYHRKERMVCYFRWQLLNDMLRYSVKIYFSEGLGFLTIYASNLITAAYLSPAALAFFSMGKGKAEHLNRITNAIGAMFYPRVSNLKGKKIDSSPLTTSAFRKTLLILVATAVLFALLIYPMTLILYGHRFLPMIAAFFIILPSLVIYNATNLQRQYFLGIGRADITMKISVAPLIIQVGLCLLLIPQIGFLGAAVAVSVAFTVTAFITMAVYLSLSKQAIREVVVPTREDVRYVRGFIREQIVRYLRQIRGVFKRPHRTVSGDGVA